MFSRVGVGVPERYNSLDLAQVYTCIDIGKVSAKCSTFRTNGKMDAVIVVRLPLGICRRLPRCCTGAAFSSKSEEDLVSCLTAAHGQASQGRCQMVTCIGRTAGPSGQCFQLLDARLLNEQGLGAEVVLLIHVPERLCGKVSERQNHFVLMYLCQEYRIVMVEQRPPPPLAFTTSEGDSTRTREDRTID